MANYPERYSCQCIDTVDDILTGRKTKTNPDCKAIATRLFG